MSWPQQTQQQPQHRRFPTPAGAEKYRCLSRRDRQGGGSKGRGWPVGFRHVHEFDHEGFSSGAGKFLNTAGAAVDEFIDREPLHAVLVIRIFLERRLYVKWNPFRCGRRKD